MNLYFRSIKQMNWFRVHFANFFIQKIFLEMIYFDYRQAEYYCVIEYGYELKVGSL